MEPEDTEQNTNTESATWVAGRIQTLLQHLQHDDPARYNTQALKDLHKFQRLGVFLNPEDIHNAESAITLVQNDFDLIAKEEIAQSFKSYSKNLSHLNFKDQLKENLIQYVHRKSEDLKRNLRAG